MTERNRLVDSLKGLFAIFVIMLHCPYETGVSNRFLFPFWVSLAVPGFMFLSGFVSAKSFESKGYGNLADCYKIKDLLTRLLRFIIPYTLAYIIEWIVFRIFGLYSVNIVTYGLRAAFFDYLLGAKGPGNYYIPILFQLVILFPIIYILIKKFKFMGLLGCFAINAIYEIGKTALGMSDALYRFLIFRYIFLIAAGAYFGICKIKSSKMEIILPTLALLAGGMFIFLFSYTDYRAKIITMWAPTSFLTALYVVAILGFFLSRFDKGVKPLEIAGKASFHIFLVQMIYFCFSDRIVEIITSEGLRLLISILISVTLGIIFYYLENPLTKYVTKKIRA